MPFNKYKCKDADLEGDDYLEILALNKEGAAEAFAEETFDYGVEFVDVIVLEEDGSQWRICVDIEHEPTFYATTSKRM